MIERPQGNITRYTSLAIHYLVSSSGCYLQGHVRPWQPGKHLDIILAGTRRGSLAYARDISSIHKGSEVGAAALWVRYLATHMLPFRSLSHLTEVIFLLETSTHRENTESSQMLPIWSGFQLPSLTCQSFVSGYRGVVDRFEKSISPLACLFKNPFYWRLG